MKNLIAILSPASASFRPVADLTEPNKRAYAAAWQLDCVFPVHTDDVEYLAWERIDFMIEALDKLTPGQWLLFMGADTIFTNGQVTATDFIGGDWDLAFAVDENGLQSDVLFIRKCPAVREWLLSVLALRGKARCEQDAMSVVLSGTLDYGDYRRIFDLQSETERDREFLHERLLGKSEVRVKVWPKRRINSMPADWEPGDFIFHAAGLGEEDRIRELTRRLQELDRSKLCQ